MEMSRNSGKTKSLNDVTDARSLFKFSLLHEASLWKYKWSPCSKKELNIFENAKIARTSPYKATSSFLERKANKIKKEILSATSE
jgi:hypothetical protein